VLLHKFLNRLWGKEGYVSREDHELWCVDRGFGAPNRMSGARRWILGHVHKLTAGKRLLHLVLFVSQDNNRALGVHSGYCAQHMFEEARASQMMKNLRILGTHARAFTGC